VFVTCGHDRYPPVIIMGTYPFTLLRRSQNPLSYYTLSNESKHNILLALVGKANPKKNSFPSRNKHENHEIGILDMLWVWGMAGHSKTCIDGPFCRTSVKTTICKRRASVNTTLSPPPLFLLHLVAEPCGCCTGCQTDIPEAPHSGGV
jgi:hypothetical protein